LIKVHGQKITRSPYCCNTTVHLWVAKTLTSAYRPRWIILSVSWTPPVGKGVCITRRQRNAVNKQVNSTFIPNRHKGFVPFCPAIRSKLVPERRKESCPLCLNPQTEPTVQLQPYPLLVVKLNMYKSDNHSDFIFLIGQQGCILECAEAQRWAKPPHPCCQHQQSHLQGQGQAPLRTVMSAVAVRDISLCIMLAAMQGVGK
jgi:hypothetical protein